MSVLKIKKPLRIKPWVAVLLIIMLSFLGMNEVFENSEWIVHHRIISYVLNFAWLFAISIIGFISLNNHSATWISKLWVMMYAFVLFLLTCLVVTRFVFYIPSAWKKDASQLRTLFMSPLPFALCLLLSTLNIGNQK